MFFIMYLSLGTLAEFKLKFLFRMEETKRDKPRDEGEKSDNGSPCYRCVWQGNAD